MLDEVDDPPDVPGPLRVDHVDAPEFRLETTTAHQRGAPQDQGFGGCGDVADATRDAAGNVADETRDTVDDATTTTEETTVRAGEDGLEVQNTETQR